MKVITDKKGNRGLDITFESVMDAPVYEVMFWTFITSLYAVPPIALLIFLGIDWGWW